MSRNEARFTSGSSPPRTRYTPRGSRFEEGGVGGSDIRTELRVRSLRSIGAGTGGSQC